MSDEAQLIHSFPPKKKSSILDLAYDREIREYIKAVERLPSDVFLADGVGGKGEDMLDVCNLLNQHEIRFILSSMIQRANIKICYLVKATMEIKSWFITSDLTTTANSLPTEAKSVNQHSTIYPSITYKDTSAEIG